MITKGTGKKRISNMLSKIGKGDVISDKAFNPYANGVTAYSLILWEVIKQNIDITGFTKAEMTYSHKEHYKLALTHIDGYKILFHGVSAGYHGEGSRGTYKILTECGFSHANKCFSNESFIVRKKAFTMSLQPFEINVINPRTSGKWKETFYAKSQAEALKQAINKYTRFYVEAV
jgi:hypothetical protein